MDQNTEDDVMVSLTNNAYLCTRTHFMHGLHTRYPETNLWGGGCLRTPLLPAPLAYSQVKSALPILGKTVS